MLMITRMLSLTTVTRKSASPLWPFNCEKVNSSFDIWKFELDLTLFQTRSNNVSHWNNGTLIRVPTTPSQDCVANIYSAFVLASLNQTATGISFAFWENGNRAIINHCTNDINREDYRKAVEWEIIKSCHIIIKNGTGSRMANNPRL
jgi:hypothetical protein